MFLRIATSLLLAALLILQSVVPCCAISKLLAGGDNPEAVPTQSHTCPCCPHSPSQQEPIPPDDGHSPDGKCPYCGGLLFHSALDDATPISEGHLFLALFGDAPKQWDEQAQVSHRPLQRQVFGQPFLNTGMRLLI